MHAFWMCNAGNFAGDSRRGKDNHAIFIAVDPKRQEAAIVVGYGLEPFLTQGMLDQLLEAASPAWQSARWADGLFSVLDGLGELLRTFAIPETARQLTAAEF